MYDMYEKTNLHFKANIVRYFIRSVTYTYMSLLSNMTLYTHSFAIIESLISADLLFVLYTFVVVLFILFIYNTRNHNNNTINKHCFWNVHHFVYKLISLRCRTLDCTIKWIIENQQYVCNICIHFILLCKRFTYSCLPNVFFMENIVKIYYFGSGGVMWTYTKTCLWVINIIIIFLIVLFLCSYVIHSTIPF